MLQKYSSIIAISLSALALLLVGMQVYWLRTAFANQEALFQWEAGIILEEAQKQVFFGDIRKGKGLFGQQGDDLEFELEDVQHFDTGNTAGLTAAYIFTENDSIAFDSVIVIKDRIETDSSRVDIQVAIGDLETRDYEVNVNDVMQFEKRLKTEMQFQMLRSSPVHLVETILARSMDRETTFRLLDSTYSSMLANYEMPVPYALRLMSDGEVVHLSGSDNPALTWSKKAPYMLKNTQHLEAGFDIPATYLVKKLRNSILVSAGLMLVMVLVFVWLIRVVYQEKKLARLKDDFIGNITHEIKTPIAIVSAALESMDKFGVLDDPEKTERYLRSARTELGRLDDLVGRILDVSLFENKQMELLKAPIDPAQEIEELLRNRQLLSNPAIQFDNQLGPVKIVTDGPYFRMMVHNLIDNALKYGGESVKVTVRLYEENGEVVLEVKDNGPGISPANQQQVFEKFYRGTSGNRHDTKGYGLGLYFVRQTMLQLGGRVRLKSQEGLGSSFLLCFPKPQLS